MRLKASPPIRDHDPDANPNWTPLLGRRVYACVACGAEKVITTNHTGRVWSEKCSGRCRTILSPHTAAERVLPFYGVHVYCRDAGEE
jgi:hypothetical protein